MFCWRVPPLFPPSHTINILNSVRLLLDGIVLVMHANVGFFHFLTTHPVVPWYIIRSSLPSFFPSFVPSSLRHLSRPFSVCISSVSDATEHRHALCSSKFNGSSPPPIPLPPLLAADAADAVGATSSTGEWHVRVSGLPTGGAYVHQGQGQGESRFLGPSVGRPP